MPNRTNKPRGNNGTSERRAAAWRKFDGVAKRAALGALFASAICGGTLRAQSIINETSGFNNRFGGFSSVSAEKIARLDEAPPKKTPAPSGSLSEANKVELALPEPKGAPRENVGSTCRVPFSFPKGSESALATAVELFCSPDLGATWHVYAGVRPEDGVDAFVFQVPKPGVYWFALKTSFANGETAFSATRAYRFVDPSAAAPAPTEETFALNETAEEPVDEPPLGTPAAPENASDGRASKLLDLAGGAPNADASQTAETGEVDASRPATGKIKSLGPAKEKGTDRLVLVLRWFRPSELEEARRGRPATIAVERAADPNGPWTRIADSLSSEREWFSWFAGTDETKPFYVRTVATDDEGNEWIDATPQPLDLSAKWARAALGRVVWPESTDDGDEEEKKADGADGKADSDAAIVAATGSKSSVGGLIRNASSVDSVDVDEPNADEEEKEASGSDGAKSSAKTKKSVATERAQTTSAAPRRPRPNVPAPTNPNEFSLNPLFTQGFGVLFQAAQTRRGDGESDSKRSIFTPPYRAPAASRVAPAEYANAASSAARRRAAQAQDMSRYEKNPELMEGGIFYMDENGELTTTPPKDFATAGVETAFGGSFPDGATTFGTGPNGEPTVLPGDNETYDANPNSGAASLTNGMYPNAATPGNSPLNRRYGTPTTAAPGASYTPSAFPNGAYQTIPETSFAPSVGARAVPSNAPVYAPTPRENVGPALFPPRPSVSR